MIIYSSGVPKILSCFFLYALTIIGANAQNSLSGKVIDKEDGSEIIGATVYISDLKKGAVTDVNGDYEIGDLPKGKFLVQIKFIGYSSIVSSIQIEGHTKLDVQLSSTATELNEIVVTGISHSSELKNNPIPITTISGKSLSENTATNLIDNITKKAGVNQITTGPGISKPVIRGLGFNRIITLYDGIRQEGQQWGDEHGIEIDEFSVDRVEIIKGAGSLMYGSDGLGGVINFIAPNPESERSVNGSFSSNFQSNNGLLGNSLSNAGNLNGFYWNARATRKDSKPYQNAYDGRVFNSGFSETDFNGYFGVSKKWGYSQFHVSSFDQTLGLVEGERDSNGNFTRLINDNGTEEEITASDSDLNSYSQFVPKQGVNHFRLSNTTNLYFGESRIQTNVGYQRNQRKEYGNVFAENKPDLYFDLSTVNYNLVYLLPEYNDWQISTGVNGMAQQNKNRGVEFLIPEYNLFDFGVFVFAKRHIGKLDLAGGARFDRRQMNIDALYLDSNENPTTDETQEQKFKAASPDFSNYSASAGATYQLSDKITAKANVSRGFRSPSIAELTSNGRHEGSLRYEYGNLDLKAETSVQLDASLVLNAKHLTAEVSVFQNTISNYIFTKKLLAYDGTDSIPNPSEPVPAYQFTQGKAQLRGGEIQIDVHPHPLDWLHFENGFSFVNAVNKTLENNDTSKYLPFIPAARLQSELRATLLGKGRKVSNLFFRLEFSHFFEQGRVLLENRTETTTPGYSLWNSGLGTDIKNAKGSTLFSFYFTVANIFDKAYQNNLSRLKYAAVNATTGRPGVYNMGRNFSFKVVVPFTIKKSD